MSYMTTNLYEHEQAVMSAKQPARWTSEFIRCIKWRIESENYASLNDTLIYLPTNTTFRFGNFKLEGNKTAIVCIPEELQPGLAFLDNVYGAITGVTVLFLLLTVAVQLWVPKEIAAQNRTILIFYKINLAVYYITIIIRYAKLYEFESLVSDVVITICCYADRSAYCWLNVLTFDMWRAFHPQRFLKKKQLTTVNSCSKRFVIQSIYAWGFPVVLVTTGILLQHLPGPVVSTFRTSGPAYGSQIQTIFMLSTLTIIVNINGIFCILIIYNIRSLKKANDAVLNSNNNQAMRLIYLKLAVVSDISFVLHIGQFITMHYVHHTAYWAVIDWISNAQGVWLFLIYCCNGSILKAVRRKVSISAATLLTPSSSTQRY